MSVRMANPNLLVQHGHSGPNFFLIMFLLWKFYLKAGWTFFRRHLSDTQIRFFSGMDYVWE